MTDLLARWIDTYVTAWNSNDPADIGALFTDDAVYRTEPYAEPWRGRAAIVAGWLDHQDQPGETRFTWHRVAADGDTHIVQGRTGYPDRTYSNLWVIRLDDYGRCREFTEWWMRHPD